MTRGILVTVAISVMVLGPGAQAGASSDTAVRWTQFSESSTCAGPYTGTPIMSRTGALASAEPILGPFGTYFGRTMAAVRTQLVRWVVPGSGGRTVSVHRSALPAFREVAANLADEAAAGRVYSIRDVSAYTPRTIGGSRQLSRHALGTAIDINPTTNPYQNDPDRLMTDMPEWFVNAWVEAGFCWGGSWKYSKDPMHFSWIGPAPGSGETLPIRPPLGSERPFEVAAKFPTIFAELAATRSLAMADVAGFGPLDVVGPRPKTNGLVLDVSSARSGFGSCSVFKVFAPIPLEAEDIVVLGDVDGDSRSDVVAVRREADLTSVRWSVRSDGFDSMSETVIPAVDVAEATIADLDGDRIGDLWLASRDALTVWAGPTFDTEVGAWPFAVGDLGFGVADRTGDGRVELFRFRHEDGGVAVDVSTLETDSWSISETAVLPVTGPKAIAVGDEDGDGRADLVVLDEEGAMTVATGNTATGRPVDGWWRHPDPECEDGPTPLVWVGTFADDDTSVFEGDIEVMADSGVTRGCDPPINERFCPGDAVSRGQMAAFLVRAFGLAPAGESPFLDTADSVFADDIAALAAAGITRGCTDSAYCPDRDVTRGEMAAFLVRALGLPVPTASDVFIDDDGSLFRSDIEALADAGITRGCDPPANRHFCPDASVSRGQMAAFLRRARR